MVVPLEARPRIGSWNGTGVRCDGKAKSTMVAVPARGGDMATSSVGSAELAVLGRTTTRRLACASALSVGSTST